VICATSVPVPIQSYNGKSTCAAPFAKFSLFSQGMSVERKSIPIKQANMLSVGDAIKIQRNGSSDSRMETNVLRIRINGKQLEINVRTGGSGKNMVISLREGGVWQEKGKTNLRNAYSLYKLV
jgi:hypothetical protein